MKIKLTQPIQSIEGEPIKKETVENGKVVEGKEAFELKDVCVNALMANIEEEKIDGTEKMKRYLLATKIQQANEIDLKSEEVAKLKELIGKVYGVLIVGQSYQLLEGKK